MRIAVRQVESQGLSKGIEELFSLLFMLCLYTVCF